MYACIEGKQDVVTYLLKQKGVDVKKKNNDGLSAMSWAARSGRIQTFFMPILVIFNCFSKKSIWCWWIFL